MAGSSGLLQSQVSSIQSINQRREKKSQEAKWHKKFGMYFYFCADFTKTLTKHGSIKKGVLLRSIWFIQVKELSLCHKLKYSTPCIFATCWCKLLKFQTLIIWSNIIYSLEYLRSTTLGCKDKGIRKSEFVVQTQFLSCFLTSYMFSIISPFIEDVSIKRNKKKFKFL